MKPSLIIFFILFYFSAFAQHPNITIGNKNNPCEPSIAINSKNTNQLMAGSVMDNCYASQDAGLTWEESILKSAFGVYGDPVIVADFENAFYYFHLSNPPKGKGNWVDRTVCNKTFDMGKTWVLDSYIGLNNAKVQDKHWVAVNPKTNTIYSTWTEFDGYESKLKGDSTRILFAKSEDGGNIWSKPKKINKVSGDCLDGDNTVEGAVPCVGPGGEIYVAWAGPAGIRFDKSTNDGNTWLREDILVDSMPGGWAFDIAGIGRANGMPTTACDASGGKNNGTIYINWCDQRNGETDTDVWLSKSIDGGLHWTNPTRVNDDAPGKQQFFTWMAIDQSTGKLWFVFYDRRNYDDQQTDVYMAMSDDGGSTFTNFKVSEKPFTPSTEKFFGDYNNLTAHNNVVRPIWTRLENKELSIHTAIVDVDNVTEIKNKNTMPISSITTREKYKNKKAEISFEVLKADYYSVKILDHDNNIINEIAKSKFLKKGENSFPYDVKDPTLKKGIYTISVYNKEFEKITSKQFLVFN